MAAQQARIEETIINLKRARARDFNHDDVQRPLLHATNRGNKLNRHAEHIQEGRMWSGDGPILRAQKINHAGFEREILYQRPQRYDEDGDLLFEDDLDEDEVNLSPAEDDIYADIKLEVLLGPLTAAADLPKHPGLAPAYTSKALDKMIDNISKILRREQENLAKMKNLLTTLRGDEQWAPCGAFQTNYDEALLQGHWPGSIETIQADFATFGSDGRHWMTGQASTAPTTAENVSVVMDTDHEDNLGNGRQTGDARKLSGQMNGVDAMPQDGDGVSVKDLAGTNVPALGPESDDVHATSHTEHDHQNGDILSIEPTDDMKEEDTASTQMSHRMTTRARATKQSEETASSAGDDDCPPIHPIFVFPPSTQQDADFGLPGLEAEAMRNFLSSHVARQEEIVRSLIELQRGLLEANRMRRNVWRWCKAEGHVGEMSDGEDWYDMEEWGLKEPLKKGEVEPDEEANNPGKKTRRRAER